MYNFQQAKFVEGMLEGTPNQRNGFFIEAGAYDGVKFSNSLLFEMRYESINDAGFERYIFLHSALEQARLVRTVGGAEPGRIPEPDGEAAKGVDAAAVLLHQDDAGGGGV